MMFCIVNKNIPVLIQDMFNLREFKYIVSGDCLFSTSTASVSVGSEIFEMDSNCVILLKFRKTLKHKIVTDYGKLNENLKELNVSAIIFCPVL